MTEELPDNVFPILPYAGTSGWSGSDTSRERAEEADASGRTAARQMEVLRLLEEAQFAGLIYKEVDEITGWPPHGSSSGALSNLHEDGRIARLAERRRRCEVYISLRYIAGRETKPYRPNSKTKGSREDAAQDLERIRDTEPDPLIREVLTVAAQVARNGYPR